jgi:hypothetical protein
LLERGITDSQDLRGITRSVEFWHR